jgi:hypothetical protein
MTMKTMTAADVEKTVQAIMAKAGEKPEGVILREIVTPEGERWLADDPTPMSPETAAAIVQAMIEAAHGSSGAPVT